MTVNPISSSLTQSLAAVAASSNRSSAPKASPSSSQANSPAATVSLSGRPSSVDADDQATYARALTAARGNVNAAAAAVASEDRKSGES
jgi:hypothetical protein